MSSYSRLTLRIFGWLIGSLLTLEFCARTEDKIRYGAPFFGNYNIDALYEITPIGKAGKPNATYLKWHLNEAGFRGPALQKDSYRVVCMGSSETFGLYESAESEWPRRLEVHLRAYGDGLPYEVVNTAFAGMSVQDNLLRMKQTLDLLHPKLVVIYPSYTRYVEVNQPVKLGEGAAFPPRPAAAGPKFEWRIADRFSTLMKSSMPEKLQDVVRRWQVRQQEKGIQIVDKLPEQNVQAFQTDLDNLVSGIESRGIRVVLVTHANRFGRRVSPEDRPYLISWRKFFPTLGEDGFLDMERRMSDVVRKVGTAHHDAVVDAATQLDPGERNFAEFVHFTDHGADSLASLVAPEVEREAKAGIAASASH